MDLRDQFRLELLWNSKLVQYYLDTFSNVDIWTHFQLDTFRLGHIHLKNATFKFSFPYHFYYYYVFFSKPTYSFIGRLWLDIETWSFLLPQILEDLFLIVTVFRKNLLLTHIDWTLHR